MTEQMFNEIIREMRLHTALLDETIKQLRQSAPAPVMQTHIHGTLTQDQITDMARRGTEMVEASSRLAGTGPAIQMPMPDGQPQPEPVVRKPEPPVPAARKSKFGRGR